MTTTEAASALFSCFALLALSALWCFGWRRWALDNFRQDLYAARDRLFDLAHQNGGEFSFDHDSYGQLRRQFHCAIRYAHRVSTMRALVFMVSQFVIGPRVRITSMNDPRYEAVVKIDPVVRPELKEVTRMWDRALIKYLALTSPLFWVSVGAVVGTAFVASLMRFMIRSFVMKTAIGKAYAKFTSVVWAEVAIADAMEEERLCRLAHA
jgi:hypothetical protein